MAARRRNLCRRSRRGQVSPCDALHSVLEYGGKRDRRVVMHQLVNARTGRLTRHLVVVYSGDHRRAGLVLNVCPFCARPLWLDDKAEQRAGREAGPLNSGISTSRVRP